jgi:hypothetical protein
LAVDTVAAVDVPVTVDAGVAGRHIYPGLYISWNSRRRDPKIGGVEGNVALPAQPDWRRFQQGGIVAAVGLMTIEAIFHDGRMLPNEWTPILGVTIEAKFFIGKSLYELGRSSPVRVVATRAVHFPLAQGMVRKFVLRTHLRFMTGSARFIYGYTGELITVRRSRSRMDRVTRRASQALNGVHTVLPEEPVPLLMAFETGLVLHGNRRCRSLRIANHTLE